MGAPVEEIRGATRRALENLVQLCIDEEAAFLLIAGDLYDGDWRDYNTGLFFASQVTRLRLAGIPVFLISGNHDAQSVISRNLRLPENAVVLSAEEAETKLLEDLGVAIHGQGFARREVPHDLSASYPPPIDGLVNIGVLHTSADGREGHDTYAPCTPASLAAKGYDYWALGHVHQREVLSESPWIVFPGNLQGRHARETGNKGASVVTVGGGAIQDVEHRELDVLRWIRSDIDARDAAVTDDVLERIDSAVRNEVELADGRLVAQRIRILGATSLHTVLSRGLEHLVEEIRQVATDAGGGQAWLEKVELRTTPSGAAATGHEGARSLLELVTQARMAPEAVEALAAALRGIALKLPSELRDGSDPLDLSDPQTIVTLAAEAEALVVARLLGTVEEA